MSTIMKQYERLPTISAKICAFVVDRNGQL
jgi:hypothetical protein